MHIGQVILKSQASRYIWLMTLKYIDFKGILLGYLLMKDYHLSTCEYIVYLDQVINVGQVSRTQDLVKLKSTIYTESS